MKSREPSPLCKPCFLQLATCDLVPVMHDAQAMLISWGQMLTLPSSFYKLQAMLMLLMPGYRLQRGQQPTSCADEVLLVAQLCHNDAVQRP